MNRENDLLYKYGCSTAPFRGFEGTKVFQLIIDNTYHINTHIDFDPIDLIDVERLKLQYEEVLEYLIVKKRFRKLSLLFKGKLSFHRNLLNENCFDVDGHVFKTLDEVEKAYNNRAFL